MTVTDRYVTITARAEDNVSYLNILADGQPIPYQFGISAPFTNTMTFNVNMARLSNGVHTIQVEAGYNVNPDRCILVHSLSQPIQINTYFELTYPDFDEMCDDLFCRFDIQSAHQNVDWEIDIYNVWDYLYWYYGYIQNIYPIREIFGSTTD